MRLRRRAKATPARPSACADERGAEALAKLPQAERGDWQRLWEEVAALQQRAQPKEK